MGDIFVSTHSILIMDGYEYRHTQFKDILTKFKTDTCEVYNRSMWSLRCEWAVHNVLYKLNILRGSTGNVNLNYPLKKKWEILYVILGTIVYPFA